MNFCTNCQHLEMVDGYRWPSEQYRCNHLKGQVVHWVIDPSETTTIDTISCKEYRYGLKVVDWRLAGKEICGVHGRFYKTKA